jgi:hypothetical protein
MDVPNDKITFSSSYYCWNFRPKQIIMEDDADVAAPASKLAQRTRQRSNSSIRLKTVTNKLSWHSSSNLTPSTFCRCLSVKMWRHISQRTIVSLISCSFIPDAISAKLGDVDIQVAADLSMCISERLRLIGVS